MKFISTPINGIYIIEPNVINDSRGYFFENFKDDIFKNKFPFINFCQENESKSSYGVLRGLHYQLPPFAQTKLVRVISGSVLDVVLDIRVGSPTFAKHFSVILNDENKKQLLVPRGFAHGFVVLSKEAVFTYKVDNYYDKKSERGILFNDKKLNINWRLEFEKIKVSKKDSIMPLLDDADLFKYSDNLYE